MTDLMQIASTQHYLRSVDRSRQERNARHLAELRHTSTQSTPTPQPRRALVPRIAGALGLF